MNDLVVDDCDAAVKRRSCRGRLWLAILGFALLLRAPYLFHKMQDIDEGCHAAIATLLVDGKLPYRDAVDNKFPGLYYVYAAVFSVFGNYNMAAVHAVALVWAVLTALLLCRFAGLLGQPAAGPWAAFFYLAFTTLFPQNLAANTEIFMALPYTASIYVLWKGVRHQRALLHVWAGLLAGLATIFKQVGGVAWAVGLVFLLWHAFTESQPKLRTLWLGVCLTLGFVLPLGLLGALYQQQGCLQDFLFWTLIHIDRYLKTGHRQLHFGIQFAACFVPLALGCSVLWLAAGHWLRSKLMRRPTGLQRSEASASVALLAPWTVMSVLATFSGQRMFPHYFIQYLPPLCLVAGLGTVELLASRHGRRWRSAMLAGSILPAVGSLLWALFYVAETPPALGRPEPDFRPAAEYVRRHSDPQDRLFVWGWFTPLYVYTQRKPGTRFVFAYVFVNYSPEYLAREKFHWIADTAVTWVEIPEAWDMLERDFFRHPPQILLDTSPGNYNKFGNFPMAHFPRLAAIVRDKYRYETTIAGVGIYRLNQ